MALYPKTKSSDKVNSSNNKKGKGSCKGGKSK